MSAGNLISMLLSKINLPKLRCGIGSLFTARPLKIPFGLIVNVFIFFVFKEPFGPEVYIQKIYLHSTIKLFTSQQQKNRPLNPALAGSGEQKTPKGCFLF